MQKPVITLKTIANDEKGTVLVLTVFLVVLFMILTMGLVEFGRMMVYNEKLQTATDAGALAAATSEVHRWVQLEVITDRGSRSTCHSCGDGDCCPACDDCGTVSRTTPFLEEKDLIENGEWKNWCYPECDCGGGHCTFKVIDRKVTYDITSRQNPVTYTDVQNFKTEMTSTVKDIMISLMERDRRWSGVLVRMMKDYVYNKTIDQIIADLSNRRYFENLSVWHFCEADVSNQFTWQGCPNDCRRNLGDEAYALVGPKLEWIKRVKNQIDKFASLQYRYSPYSTVERKAEDYAEYYFFANAPEGSDIAAIKVHDRPGDPYYPSVTVYAKGYLLPLLASTVEKITGPVNMKSQTTMKAIPVVSCSQGTTFYRDPSTQTGEYTGSLKGLGKWIRKPEESCWRDYSL